jgi:hypothetical protein
VGALRYVDTGYRHHPKRLTPGEGLVAGQAQLKWYNLARAEDGVPVAVERLARAFLLAEVQAGRVGGERELGFVVLHRCGLDFYFLILNTWRGSNEVWESVFYQENSAMPGFGEYPRQGPHRPTYCVWELGAVCHEQHAWAAFLSSGRTPEDEARYLADSFSGNV